MKIRFTISSLSPSHLWQLLFWARARLVRHNTLGTAGIIVVGAVYAVVVPDIVLINTGAVPDTFVSWVFAGVGALLALVLVVATRGVTSYVKLASHRT